MKTIRTNLLCILALALLLPVLSLADTAVFFENQESDYSSLHVADMTRVGDTVYMLVEDDAQSSGLYAWKEGQEAPEKVGDNIFLAQYAGNMENLNGQAQDGQDPAHAVARIFSDGESLYALHPLSGLIFRISVENGQASYEDVCTVSDLSLVYNLDGNDYVYLPGEAQIAVCGDAIVWSSIIWNEEGQNMLLTRISLSDGKAELVPTETANSSDMNRTACSYTADAFLMAERDWEHDYDSETGEWKPYQVYEVNPVTGEKTLFGEIKSSNVSGMRYDPEKHTLFYLDGTKIMGLRRGEAAVQWGFIPSSIYTSTTEVIGGTFLAADWNACYLRNLTENFRTDNELTTYGVYQREASRQFAKQYPDVPVYTYDGSLNGNENVLETMRAGDIDIISMNIAYGSYETFRDKGYCMDLSGSKVITDYISRLYDPFKAEAVYKDRVVAIPTGAYSSGWYAFNEALESVGLSREDVPTNLVDLSEFLNEWNDDYAEDHPDVVPMMLYGNSTRQTLAYTYLEKYLKEFDATGKELRFDTEEFRTVMQALDSIRSDNYELEMPEDGDDEAWESFWSRGELLSQDYSVVGDWYPYGNRENMTFIPMTLTPDTEYHEGVTLNMVFINPWSKHQDLAVAYLECLVESILGTQEEYTMCADMTEPLENPSFDRMVESINEYIAQLRVNLDTVEDDEQKEILAQLLEEEEKYAGQMEQYRYTISEEALKYYQEEIASHIFVVHSNFLYNFDPNDQASSEIQSLVSRLMDGQIELEQFIREADGKVRMMQWENE